MNEGKQKVIITKALHEQLQKFELCGYSNCFRPYFKHRGFMPTCEFHYKHPQKWGKDGHTFTGSVFRKKSDSLIQNGDNK
jgi:hypothetical protein